MARRRRDEIEDLARRAPEGAGTMPRAAASLARTAATATVDDAGSGFADPATTGFEALIPTAREHGCAGMAVHPFCSHCGIKAFYCRRAYPQGGSVNARCLDEATIKSMSVTRRFDGADWENTLESYQLAPA